MSDGITCYDTIVNDQFPPGADAYAGYVDGSVADQPNYAWIAMSFPAAEHIAVTLDAGVDPPGLNPALDVENGAARVADVPGWHARQAARGVARPIVYASAYTMRDGILPVLAGAGIARTAVRLWSAHYEQEHICGPGTCALLPDDADGTQWTETAMGRDLDRSLLLRGFFGPTVLPPGWTYGPPAALAATGGHTTVGLEWAAPQGYPAPAGYRIWVYRGTLAHASALVESYPRNAGAVNGWEGGGLVRGQVYTAHVAAAGPGWSRMRPYGFASAIFATG
jgi:hypothetical protein